MRLLPDYAAAVIIIRFALACSEPTQYRPEAGSTRGNSVTSYASTDEDDADDAEQFAKIQRPSDASNTFSTASGKGAFPKLQFAISNIPTKGYEFSDLSAQIDSERSISSYAFKLAVTNSCSNPDGYRSAPIAQTLKLNFEEFPIGPIYLCLLAFHEPSRRWQPADDAIVYSWQKIAFKRAFRSTYTMVDDVNCATPTTVNVVSLVTINGKYGTSTWTRQRTPGCTDQTSTVTDAIYNVKATSQEVTGNVQNGPKISSWFHWRFLDTMRTSFAGEWGYGELDVGAQGSWKSN